MSVFQFMNPGSQCLCSVSRIYLQPFLQYQVSIVVMPVHEVNTDAGFRFTGSDYGLVYVHAVHALSAVIRQQGGVNVDDSLRPFFNHTCRYQPQETGQRNPIRTEVLQLSDDVRIIHTHTADIDERNITILGNLSESAFRTVGQEYTDAYTTVVRAKVRNDAPGIGAPA